MKKDRTSRHLGLKRTLKGKYLKIQTKNLIRKVLQRAAEMTIKLKIQVIKMYMTCIICNENLKL